MKFSSILAVYCSANLQVGTLQFPAPAGLKTGATGIKMLFHWRSPGKTIYSPEVRIIAKSLDRNLGSAHHFARSALERSPRLENRGGLDETVCAGSGIFPVCAASHVGPGGSGHCIRFRSQPGEASEGFVPRRSFRRG